MKQWYMYKKKQITFSSTLREHASLQLIIFIKIMCWKRLTTPLSYNNCDLKEKLCHCLFKMLVLYTPFDCSNKRRTLTAWCLTRVFRQLLDIFLILKTLPKQRETFICSFYNCREHKKSTRKHEHMQTFVKADILTVSH